MFTIKLKKEPQLSITGKKWTQVKVHSKVWAKERWRNVEFCTYAFQSRQWVFDHRSDISSTAKGRLALWKTTGSLGAKLTKIASYKAIGGGVRVVFARAGGYVQCGCAQRGEERSYNACEGKSLSSCREKEYNFRVLSRLIQYGYLRCPRNASCPINSSILRCLRGCSSSCCNGVLTGCQGLNLWTIRCCLQYTVGWVVLIKTWNI